MTEGDFINIFTCIYELETMQMTQRPQTDAGTKTALNELYKAINKQESAHAEVALLVADDFNAGKLKSILPHFYQHVTCATRGKKL